MGFLIMIVAAVLAVVHSGVGNVQMTISALASTTDMGNGGNATTLPPTKKSVGGGTTSKQTSSPSGYTLAEIAAHATAASCWSAINGTVYDLTSWISQHPGGEGAILSICGKDGSAAFNNQHGGQSRPEKILATYKIGLLAQ